MPKALTLLCPNGICSAPFYGHGAGLSRELLSTTREYGAFIRLCRTLEALDDERKKSVSSGPVGWFCRRPGYGWTARH
jgi:hypothetical protein